MTPADWAGLLQHQAGGCALCGARTGYSGRRLAVDHDHDTGLVRGLLCTRCNLTVGRVDALAKLTGMSLQDVCQLIATYLSGPQYGN